MQEKPVSDSTVFFLRCMECQCGLAMRKVSVSPSVCLSNTCTHMKTTDQIFQKILLDVYLWTRKND